jgi:hypothetical protein
MSHARTDRRLTLAQEEELGDRAWQQSLDGASNSQIARILGVSPKTVARLLTTRRAELHQQRVASGEADRDLILYLDRLDDTFRRAFEIYNKVLVRLMEEEELERQHNEERARRGQLPPTTVTRALKYHMHGLPNALRALDSMRVTWERRARVLGLEEGGKLMARSQFVAKRQELLELLNTPLEVTIRHALPTPEGWDVPEDDED